MAMKKAIVISIAFVFLTGCGFYEMGDQTLMSLDEALDWVDGYKPSYYYTEGWGYYCIGCDRYPDYLKRLRKQALNEEDERIIDAKIDEYTQEHDKFMKAGRERVEREQAERERQLKAAFERCKREIVEFIRSAPGSLEAKMAQEVKKLVDKWRELQWRCKSEFLSVENFYKVFGKPERTSLMSSLDTYYLHYTCKDGLVQIQVLGRKFDEGEVYITDLNIF